MIQVQVNTQGKRVLIAGANGFIGKYLLRSLHKQGFLLNVLQRKSSKPSPDSFVLNQSELNEESARIYSWSPDQKKIDLDAVRNVDVVLCLNGASIGKLWTRSHKRKMINSRINSATTIVEAISQLKPEERPAVILGSSAIGFYGDRGNEILAENSCKGQGFLSDLCLAWEEEFNQAQKLGVRVVNIRTGLVLHPSGGMLKTLAPSYRLFGGITFGQGDNWMSPISLSDYSAALEFCIEHDQISGPVNFVVPSPVTAREFTKISAKHWNQRSFLKLPRVLLAILPGNMGKEMIIASQRVVPEKLLSHGFLFSSPTVNEIYERF
ncbi:TIGR01777 family oxidoreductase [Arcanobacterium ihumii]|uniref:TIGR01777 family oxidoreductase n=1 Tax=Arcanobacterium ihumii TaxID=2138162 RepID=UPI000F525358|nr:TIGR01777 family oxidoreductase [Arcanobacterium ihumii]